MVDQSFALQAIMEMHKELGVLGQKIDGMRGDLADAKADGKETRTKLTEVEKSLAAFNGAKVVLQGLFALLLVGIGALLAWLLKT